MTSTSQHRGRRIAGAVVLATALALTPAGSAVAKPKPSAPAAKCKPGAIKKVKGKGGHLSTYVCDTKGKWIEVVAIVAEIGEPVEVGAEATAERALKPTATPKPTRCMIAGGVYVDVGDVIVETSYVRDEDGNTVSITRRKYLCGADGQLHEVFAIVAGPQSPAVSPTQAPEKTR